MKQAESIHASPLARRIAAERGVIAAVKGSGPGGRSYSRCRGRVLQSGSNVGATANGDTGAQRYLLVRHSSKGMRRTITQRMHESLKRPRNEHGCSAAMDDAVKLRTQLVKEWEGIAKPTFTDLVIRAVAKHFASIHK